MTDAPSDRLAPPAFLQRGAAAAVLATLPGARAVGGCVRDHLAGRPIHDVDVGVPLPPEDVAQRLKAAGLRVFETGLSHGTITAVLEHVPVEVTSLRRDVTTDGRHAEVAWTTDWREDASRRDFTMNAMSLTADGRLWDYFAGRADLAAGRVRFVGDAATRLAEDYLRALRYFRFQARYGLGAPDAGAVAAICAAVPGLARLSVERVWMELKRLLEAPDPSDALALMQETGVLGAAVPALVDLHPLRHAPPDLPRDPLLRFALLVDRRDRGLDLPHRLRWSGDEARFFIEAREIDRLRGPLTDDDLRRLLAVTSPRHLINAAWVAEAWGQGGDWRGLRARLAAMPVPVFPLQGRDALAAGIPAGPEMGRLLAATRAWWLAAGCTPDQAACLARLRELAGPPASC